MQKSFLLCAIAITHALRAQQADDIPTFTLPQIGAGPALLIFVSDYGGRSAFADLPGVKKDRAAMLGTVEKLGFKDVTVVENPTLDQMKGAMSDFGNTAAKSTKASFFYFSGHGVLHKNLNYLVPAHAPIETQGHLPLYAVPAEHVTGFLAGKRTAGPCLFFVDACRNNTLPADDKGAGGDGIDLDNQAGMFIGYATDEGKTSGLTQEGSLFTTSLAKRLLTPGRSVDDLFAGVVVDVEKHSQALNHAEIQPPQKMSSLRYVLHLVPGPVVYRPLLVETIVSTAPASSVAPVIPQPDVRLQKLIGHWRRNDAGRMVISIRQVLTGGSLQAGYANPDREPQDVHVGSAKAQISNSGRITLSVQMDDEGYRGSIYHLTYNASDDELVGTYRAQDSDKFDVSFTRLK